MKFITLLAISVLLMSCSKHICRESALNIDTDSQKQAVIQELGEKPKYEFIAEFSQANFDVMIFDVEYTERQEIEQFKIRADQETEYEDVTIVEPYAYVFDEGVLLYHNLVNTLHRNSGALHSDAGIVIQDSVVVIDERMAFLQNNPHLDIINGDTLQKIEDDGSFDLK